MYLLTITLLLTAVNETDVPIGYTVTYGSPVIQF